MTYFQTHKLYLKNKDDNIHKKRSSKIMEKEPRKSRFPKIVSNGRTFKLNYRVTLLLKLILLLTDWQVTPSCWPVKAACSQLWCTWEIQVPTRSYRNSRNGWKRRLQVSFSSGSAAAQLFLHPTHNLSCLNFKNP